MCQQFPIEVDGVMWGTGTGWAARLVMTLAMVGVWALDTLGIIAVLRPITDSRGQKGDLSRDASAPSMRGPLGAGLTPSRTGPVATSYTGSTRPRGTRSLAARSAHSRTRYDIA